MDNDQIQQTNLVTDDAAAAMPDAPQPETIQPKPSAPATTSANPQQPTEPPTSNPPAQSPTTPDPATVPATETPTSEPSNDLSGLDDIKKKALDELQPLIEHVEQSPEERYETVMMMIRSSDDPGLVNQAYDAAKGIENEKIRANALLNIVSEIEYLKSKTSS